MCVTIFYIKLWGFRKNRRQYYTEYIHSAIFKTWFSRPSAYYCVGINWGLSKMHEGWYAKDEVDPAALPVGIRPSWYYFMNPGLSLTLEENDT